MFDHSNDASAHARGRRVRLRRTRAGVLDPVTGLGNEVALTAALREHAGRHGVVALELDGEAPDDALRQLGARVRSAARGAVACRTGGSEVILVLPGERGEAVRAAGERVRAAVAAEPFRVGPLGASVGVAWDGDDVLAAARTARATARALGGNQTRAAGDAVGVPTLEAVADAVDERRGQPGHSRRVAQWCRLVAEQLGDDAHTCERAGRLHDIGLVAAPESLLLRPHALGQEGGLRIVDHLPARPELTAVVREALPDVADAIVRHRRPLADDPPAAARVLAVCNAWATMREGRPGRAPLPVADVRAHLLAGSGTRYAPAVVRTFLALEAAGQVGETPAPVPSRTADAILAATAAAPLPRSARPHRRRGRPAVMLAGALVVIASWTGSAAWLQIKANHQERRVVDLTRADRYLHELELLRGRTLGGDIDMFEAAIVGRSRQTKLEQAIARANGSARLRGGITQLAHNADLITAAMSRGDIKAVARIGNQADDQMRQLDAQMDAEIDGTQRAADRSRAYAWQFGAGSGVLALLVAGGLLLGYMRARRAAVRLRTAAARAEGERAALRESDRRFRALVQHASDSVLVIDPARTIRFATDSIERLLGRGPETLAGRRVDELVDPEHRGRLLDVLLAARGMPGATAGELTLRHADGRAVHADLRVADRVADPDVAGFVLTIRDVSEQRRLASELRRSALIDRATGLPNRLRFEEWLQAGLAAGSEVALVLIDLDDFKAINDSLGHPAGDRCLVVWAERLRAAVGHAGKVARLGGDEFGVVLEGISSPESAEYVARRVLDAVGGSVELDGVELPLTASAGVALASPGDLTEDLLRGADTAAHAAKAGGAGRVAVYSPSMHARAVRRLGLRSALARAVEREELELAYQPLIDLESGAISGVEALLRWRTADGEPVSPADFIPIAEASGLIVPLGAWVLRRACAEIAALEGLEVSVNVSAVQLRSAEFVRHVADALEASGLDPQRLVLELTESALMDDVAHAHDTLAGVRALGVRVAIDDFGTGFSSLATLADLPVDVLKLDRSFIAAMGSTPAHAALVGGVVSLADRLGLPLVAEGVETAEQLEALQELGCAFAQGYHLGRPGPLAAVDGRPHSLR